MRAYGLSLLAAVVALTTGCDSPAPPKLTGAVYATLPVYSPAKVSERSGFETESGEGLLWTLTTSDPFEKVRDHYAKRVPAGSEYDDGANDPNRKTWEYKLPEMAEGERVQLTVKRVASGTEIALSEVVKPGKRPGGL